MKKIFLFSILTILFSSCYMTKKSDVYYGIDTSKSKHVVFLVDISGSMEGKAETDLQGNIIAAAGSKASNVVGDAVGGPLGNVIKKQANNQLTKLGKAKKELIPTIKGLSEDTYFTIIIFENDVKTLKKELMQATSANKGIATVYLDRLSSGGGTNIYESLENAFQITNIETIFLLSDGTPTAGKVTSPNEILEAVTKWNSLNKITIHTIGLGEDCDKEFMRKLAEQNSGKFIDK